MKKIEIDTYSHPGLFLPFITERYPIIKTKELKFDWYGDDWSFLDWKLEQNSNKHIRPQIIGSYRLTPPNELYEKEEVFCV